MLPVSCSSPPHHRPAKAWVKTYRSWAAVINHNLHHFDTFGPGVPPVGEDDVNLHFHPIQWASGFQTLYPYAS
jgi:hypothetical protein